MMLHRPLVLCSLVVLGAALAACPKQGGGEGEGGEGEGEGEGGGGSTMVLDSTETVDVPDIADVEGVALTTRADGRAALVYVNDRTDGAETDCAPTFGSGDNKVKLQDVVVSDEQPDGSFRTRIVDSIPQTFGDSVSITTDPASDALVVAYMGGAVAQGVCQSSDLVVAVENGDTFGAPVTVAQNSSDGSGPCRTQQNVCAQGDTVGRYPWIMHDKTGANWALPYLDLHFGFGADDIEGSDLEVGLGGSAASYSPITTVSSDDAAGYFLSGAMTDDGRAVVIHNIIAGNTLEAVPGDPTGGSVTVHAGLYIDVEQTDGSWLETSVLQNGLLDNRASAAVGPDGLYGIARDTGTKQLLLFHSVDDGQTWSTDFVERIGLTGFYPNVGFLSDGTLVTTYQHCNDQINADGACDRKKDGIRVTWKDSTSDTSFQKKTFTEGDEDSDGTRVSMSITPDDTIVVASLTLTAGGEKKIKVMRIEKQVTP